MRTRPRTLIAIIAVAGLGVAACGSDPEPTAQPTPASDQATPTAETSAPESTEPEPTVDVDPAAEVGQCFTTSDLAPNVSTDPPVECEPGTYTQITVAVADLPDDLPLTYPEYDELLADIAANDGQATDEQQSDVDAFKAAIEPLSQECLQATTDLILPDKTTAEETLFIARVTGPNAEQWDAGQRWFRCNIAKRSADREDDTLLPLPEQLDGAGYELANKRCKVLEDGQGAPWRECSDPTLTGTVLINTFSTPGTDVRAQTPASAERASQIAAEYCADSQDPYVTTDRRGDAPTGHALEHNSGDDGTIPITEAWDTARINCLISIEDYTPTREK